MNGQYQGQGQGQYQSDYELLGFLKRKDYQNRDGSVKTIYQCVLRDGVTIAPNTLIRLEINDKKIAALQAGDPEAEKMHDFRLKYKKTPLPQNPNYQGGYQGGQYQQPQGGYHQPAPQQGYAPPPQQPAPQQQQQPGQQGGYAPPAQPTNPPQQQVQPAQPAQAPYPQQPAGPPPPPPPPTYGPQGSLDDIPF